MYQVKCQRQKTIVICTLPGKLKNKDITIFQILGSLLHQIHKPIIARANFARKEQSNVMITAMYRV